MFPAINLVKAGYQVPVNYLGFSNGLFYYLPARHRDATISPLDPDEGLDPNCQNVTYEITDPDPFKGYDCRCRPWYQLAFTEKEPDTVLIGEPYLFYSGNIGVTPAVYFNLEGQ